MAAANNRARKGNLHIYSSGRGFLRTFRRDGRENYINAESTDLIDYAADTDTSDGDPSTYWRHLTKQAATEASDIDENELGSHATDEAINDSENSASDEHEIGCDAIEDNGSQDAQEHEIGSDAIKDNGSQNVRGKEPFETDTSLNALEHISVNMIQGDITKISADVIIISGNNKLSPLGGVAKAIFDAAGFKLETDIRKKTRGKKLEVGEVVFTSSGELKRNISQIAHIVMPTWTSFQHHTGKKTCVYRLISALYDCFEECAKTSITKIALPAIGTGYSGIPQELCSLVYLFALNKLNKYCKEHRTIPKMNISFVDINTKTLACISKTFRVTSMKDCHNIDNSIEEELAKLFPVSTYNIGRKIEVNVFQGDITLFLGCSVLCAVNEDLKPRGRVAESIFKQAGKEFQKELSHKEKGTIQIGDVIVTGPWGSYWSHIFSCVVPKRRLLFKGRYKDELIKCYKNVFRSASEKKIHRMTLYVLGADGFYPDIDLCCSAMTDSLGSLSTSWVKKRSLPKLHITCSDKTLLDCLLTHARSLQE